MSRPGKETRGFMKRAVYAHLGLRSKKLRVAPGIGLDNGAVSIGGGRVLIVTVDPISAIPAFGMELSAWLSVHLIASDYTTSGTDPEFATFSYNFPQSMSKGERELYVGAIGDECRKLGVSVVGGHTGSYPGAGFTVIGAGSMLGVAPEDGFVSPSMASVGDSIVMTKHAAIEATASLAASFPRYTEERIGAGESRRATDMAKQCSTVRDARIARRVGLGRGAVSSMHDATEGGVLGGLGEMATASGKRFAIDLAEIPIAVESARVCSAFGLDPLSTMGEGSLLITCSRQRATELTGALRRSGIRATEIGRVEDGEGVVLSRGSRRPARYTPGPDRYWAAYESAVRRGLG